MGQCTCPRVPVSVSHVSQSGDDVGGLVGVNKGGSVMGSFWDMSSTGQETSDGGDGF